MVAEKNNMRLVNYAVEGASWVRFTGRPCLQDQVTTMLTSTDYPQIILLSGGLNDSWNDTSSPIGSVTDEESAYGGGYDTETFCGAIEQALYAIRRKFPLAKVCYVITYRCGGKFGNQYAPAIREVLHKLAIPYVDLTREGIMNNNSLLLDRSTFFTDNIHPNAKAYARIGQMVESLLKEIN